MRLEVERHAVAEACRALVDQRLVVGTAGNVSVRVGDLVVISPSGVGYATMTAQDVGVHDLAGAVVEASLEPSSELALHLAVHAARAARATEGDGDHGAVVVGGDLAATVAKVAYLEYVCDVHLRAMSAGVPVAVLDDAEVSLVAQRLRGYGQGR